MGKYVCRRFRLCTYLVQNGFNYIEEKTDKYNPNYKVWIFENSIELRVTIEEYYNREEFINR